MRHVSYAANADGYIIRVYEDGEVIKEYMSAVPAVLADVYSDARKVKAFAKTTALTVAADYHVNHKYVHYDEKLIELILSGFASITVLNDTETFTGTRGCEVVEYHEADAEKYAPSYQDADEIVPLVLDGTIRGHIYSIPALVNLYKALLACESLPDGITGKLDDVEQVA